MDGERRGVDHDVGQFDDRAHRPAFLTDGVGDRPVVSQRVAVACFREAAGQDLVVAIEEQHAETHVRAGAEWCQDPGENFRLEPPGAKIDADGDRLVAAGADAGRVDQAADQVEGQVVDDLVAEILEALQRGGLAGAGHARHQEDAKRLGGLAAGAHLGCHRR